MRRLLWIPWRWWRRVTQFALLLVFLWLFRRTEYTGADQLAGGENLFFRLDPLAAAAAMLAARQFISQFWPALVVVAMTMILGRFFCGWVCPLGTLLDYFHRVLRLIGIISPLSLWERVRVRAEHKKTTDCLQQAGDAATALTPCPSPKGRGELVVQPALTAAARSARYVLLIVMLVSAVFAFPLVGLVDPFALLVRGMALWGDPMLYRGVDACFGWIGDGWATETLQPFVKKHLLPFRPMIFHLAGVSAAILAVIFALELVARRFWCRYLCPAGAMLGLLARRSLAKRVPARVCKACDSQVGTAVVLPPLVQGEKGRQCNCHPNICAEVCRMDALDPAAGLSPEACTLCMDCVDFCPKGIVKFTIGTSRKAVSRQQKNRHPERSEGSDAKSAEILRSAQDDRRHSRPVDLSRRTVLAGIAAGAAIPGAALAARLGHVSPVAANLLRPPGADDEKTFLSLCIRCGECMKVCPTNVLQPAILESGLEGVFSPHLVPRFIFEQSNCEYTCTLCGQVCPTGAIPRLTEEAKHAYPTGKAYFDHNLCLPWAEKTPCIRCEEMCPASDKAIKILNTFKIKNKDGEEVEIQRPYVDRDLCVGCGICESNCTIEGISAIRVQRVEAPDPGTEFLLKPQDRISPRLPNKSLGNVNQ